MGGVGGYGSGMVWVWVVLSFELGLGLGLGLGVAIWSGHCWDFFWAFGLLHLVSLRVCRLDLWFWCSNFQILRF